MDFLNLALGFLEGLALIASPCILPVLPIVLSAGLAGNKARPYGVTVGFILSFWAFTLLSRKLVILFNWDTSLVREISYGLLLCLGTTMLSERLSVYFEQSTQGVASFGSRITSRLTGPSQKAVRSQGFWSGLLIGLLIGLVWSPCVGPIIALVLVQTIRQTTDGGSALLLAAFSLGVGLPMLLMTLGGKTVISRFDFLKSRTTVIRKSLGAVIVVTVAITAASQWLQLPSILAAASPASTSRSVHLAKAVPRPYPSPNFQGINAWINTPDGKSLDLKQLRGKVVLVDFWTYSCINCVRTLPVISAWDRNYRDKGLFVVGIHSPEFDFEKKLSNVQAAVRQHGLQYPVGLDNRLDTFTAFQNQYWPAHYLIDRSGKVVYTHFGEGDYEVTESNIRALLGLSATGSASRFSSDTLSTANQTPETYLGYARAETFNSAEKVQRDRQAIYTFPNNLPLNAWALTGHWKISAQKATTITKNAALRLHFNARKVYLVIGTASNKPVSLDILLNGRPVTAKNEGRNVKDGKLTVQRHTLYELIRQEQPQSGLLEIRTSTPGVSVYAFTFG